MYRNIFTCLLLTSFWSPVIQAALPPIYDVEVIIFTNKYPNDDGEQWQTPDFGAIAASGFFPENQFTELAGDLYTIENISTALERSGRHSVLFHRAWRQLAYDKANAVAYPVHSLAENGQDSVEGLIKVVRERFLHLDVDIQLMSAAEGTEVLYSDSPDSQPAFELIENRRIKSNVLHYFDHPRFGMIARVTPYIPEETGLTEEAGEITGVEVPQATLDESPEIELEKPQMNPADDQLTR